MLVVVNIDPGSTLNELMAFLAERHVTFSFTDQLWKLCDKTVTGERKESSSQTDTDAGSVDPPLNKKSRQSEECASPCSSATPSEPTTNGTDGANQNSIKHPVWEYMARNGVNPKKEDEPQEIIEEDDEMSNDFMQSELMQLMLSKIKNEGDCSALANITDDIDEDSLNLNDFSGAYGANPTAGAIRFKPTYASTKRGVCQVCNREVSLITTHRKRHAITHLGFKTLKCAVCHKYFSRQDLASGHFKKDHPDAEYTPFLDTMSSDDERQLTIMMTLCFPDESTKKLKSKETTPSAQKRTRT